MEAMRFEAISKPFTEFFMLWMGNSCQTQRPISSQTSRTVSSKGAPPERITLNPTSLIFSRSRRISSGEAKPPSTGWLWL